MKKLSIDSRCFIIFIVSGTVLALLPFSSNTSGAENLPNNFSLASVAEFIIVNAIPVAQAQTRAERRETKIELRRHGGGGAAVSLSADSSAIGGNDDVRSDNNRRRGAWAQYSQASQKRASSGRRRNADSDSAADGESNQSGDGWRNLGGSRDDIASETTDNRESAAVSGQRNEGQSVNKGRVQNRVQDRTAVARQARIIRSNARKQAHRVVNRADRNNDGVISRRESPELVRRLVRNGADINDDGRISTRELTRFNAMQSGNVVRAQAAQAHRVVSRTDRNNDGVISRQESPGLVQRLVKNGADINDDGRISARELTRFNVAQSRNAVRAQVAQARRVVNRADSNNDGVISRQELPGLVQRLVRNGADVNDDGRISARELTRFNVEQSRNTVREQVFRARDTVERVDRNNDGVISRRESPRLVRRLVNNGADINDDGRLSARELACYRISQGLLNPLGGFSDRRVVARADDATDGRNGGRRVGGNVDDVAAISPDNSDVELLPASDLVSSESVAPGPASALAILSESEGGVFSNDMLSGVGNAVALKEDVFVTQNDGEERDDNIASPALSGQVETPANDFNEFDINQDGVITKSELMETVQSQVAGIDLDGNGSISLEEYQIYVTGSLDELSIDEIEQLAEIDDHFIQQI